MLSLVHNNEILSRVERFSCAQVALNPEETRDLLLETPREQFVMSSAGYQMSREQILEIAPELLPSLKHLMKGPFVMQISNRGGEATERSLLCFDIVPMHNPDKYIEGSDKILIDPCDMTVKSLAALPFLDVFKEQIEREADYAERLIKKSQNRFRYASQRKDRDTVSVLTETFMKGLRGKDTASPTDRKPIGQEAISDILSSNLNAKTDFYRQFWDNLQEAYAPVIRRIGEEYALGQVDLDTSDLQIR